MFKALRVFDENILKPGTEILVQYRDSYLDINDWNNSEEIKATVKQVDGFILYVRPINWYDYNIGLDIRFENISWKNIRIIRKEKK